METAKTYLIRYGDGDEIGSHTTDLGHTFRVEITATNLDGEVSDTSGASPVVTTPPAPVNSTIPKITAPAPGPGVGRVLTGSTANGDWLNGTKNFDFQWQRCDATATETDTSSCVDFGPSTNVLTPPTGSATNAYSTRVT